MRALNLTIGSLFSGIGGLDLGLELAGIGEPSWFCEADGYCTQVLARHWPGVPVYPDVATLEEAPHVDIIAGGFPCQDISKAGNGAGLAGRKSGLFYELMRIVRLVGPRFIVLENVSAITDRGRGLDDVLRALAEEGFDAEWACIRASDLGAPHQRNRWFCVAWRAVANANGDRQPQPGGRLGEVGRRSEHGGQAVADADGDRLTPRGLPKRAPAQLAVSGLVGGPLADPMRPGRQELDAAPVTGPAVIAPRCTDAGPVGGRTQSRMGRDADGLPAGLDLRGLTWMGWPSAQDQLAQPWEPPRTVQAASVSARPARIRALGNAVTPAQGAAAGLMLRRIIEREGLA
jgi:DNA (cytosine-5)-methyltransferase 1